MQPQNIQQGSIFVITGSSGVGKSGIIKQILEQVSGIGFSVSHTTRKPRPSEIDGREYHFINHDTFNQMIEDDKFLEHAKVHEEMYGTSLEAVMSVISQGKDVILDIDVQGAENLMIRYRHAPDKPDIHFVMILPPSKKLLRERLVNRGDSNNLSVRISAAESEMNRTGLFDHFIVNEQGKMDLAVGRLVSIILDARGERGGKNSS